MKNNLFTLDKLTMYVKKSKVDHIVQQYSAFGWDVVDQTENKKYEDIVDITFSRPHTIQNKDHLQLLQVYMEDGLNRMGKLENNKYPVTISLGLCAGVLGLLMLVLGGLFAFSILPVLGIIGGCIMAFLGLALLILGSIAIPKVFRKEVRKYQKMHAILEREIKDIVKEAKALRGGQDGKTK